MEEPLIFDAHVHIWADDRRAYPQVPEWARPEAAKGRVEWLLDLMAAAGVSGALLVQTPWYGEDNRYYVDTLRRYPGRFIAMGYLPDPLAADAPAKLRAQYERDGFRGIRIHLVESAIVEGVATGKADPLLREAGALGVPVEFLNRSPENYLLIFELARRFPAVRFIHGHLGHPRIAEGYPYPSSRFFFASGHLPNVYAKVSQHHAFSATSYPWADLDDFQKRTLESYGAQKLMWGSNFPMAMPNPSYRERLDAVRLGLPFLGKEERAWILGGTARALWKFPLG